MNANPTCSRCGAAMVWIGIGPAAEAVCPKDCIERCPQCKSPNIEPFVTWSYYAFVPAEATSQMHCLPCGAVFARTGARP